MQGAGNNQPRHGWNRITSTKDVRDFACLVLAIALNMSVKSFGTPQPNLT